MRMAYADPPYIGRGSGYYDHPDSRAYREPAAHVALIAKLDAEYDGWAVSCSSPSLPDLLAGAPAGIRVAAWVKPFAAYKANIRIAYAWEPVIFKAGRDRSADGAPIGRDYLAEKITLQKGLTGAKPVAFCRWVLDLLGYVDGDELEDVFPGTGVMGRVAAQLQFAV